MTSNTHRGNGRAHLDVSGGPALWQSLTHEPLIEVLPGKDVAGRWLRLTWRSGLYETLCRPIVRCLVDRGDPELCEIDYFPPAAAFGRGVFTFWVPAGTRHVLISPTDRPGSFRFELEDAAILGTPRVLLEAARIAPGKACLAYLAFWVLRFRDARSLLQDALAEMSPAALAQWRRRGQRSPDPAFDGSRPNSSPKIRLIVGSETDAPDTQAAAIATLEADLAIGNIEGVEVVADRGPSGDPVYQGLAPADLIAAVPVGTRLHSNGIDMLRAAALRHPDIDLFYGDDDFLDGSEPAIRPGFDPLLLRSLNYIGTAAVWRTRAVADLMPASTAPLPRPEDARSGFGLSRFIFRFPRRVENARRSEPVPAQPVKHVSPAAILIPTRDRLDLLKPCVDSILAKSSGQYRLHILDNDSAESATLAYLDAIAHDPRVAVHRIGGPFNFSRICNEGSRRAAADVLIFLNNDTTIIDADWVERLTSAALEPDVGAVGARLLYPDETVQHAGVVLGLYGRAGHFEAGISRDSDGFFGRARVPHHLTAVTGACLAVEASKFWAVDGFDDVNLPIDLNDIDLCLRLVERGFKTVQLGDCLLFHHESASRGRPDNTQDLYRSERAYFSARWSRQLRADPYFSPSLSLYSTHPRLG